MKNATLKEKDKQVLNLIVENYLKVGRPVSSGLLSQKKKIPDSPATLRNIMVKLEDLGFLHQPHTSAGRVPTDKGLRFYVNHLFATVLHDGGQTSPFGDEFAREKGDFDSLLTKASKVLAEQSDNLAFVISPRISKIQFRYLRFIKVGEDRVLVILVTTFNMVLTEVIKTDIYFSQTELDNASEYANQNFRGKNLLTIRDHLFRELPTYRRRYELIVNKLISFLKTYFLQEEKESRIFFQGAARLIDKPELFDMERLKVLFQNFEERAKLASLLSEFITLDRVKVLIGSESNVPDIEDCSLILSHYGTGNQVLGSLGVLGPKRIPYERIIPLVDGIAKQLSQTISHHS
jgi:heat-inducible transcriptional repressor